MISRGFTYISLVYNKRQEKIYLRPPNLKVKNTRPSVIKCVVFVNKKLWWDTLLLYQTHYLYTIMPLALYIVKPTVHSSTIIEIIRVHY